MLNLRKTIPFLIITLMLIGITGCAGKSATIDPQSGEFSTDPEKISDIVITLDPGSYELKRIVWSENKRDAENNLITKDLVEGVDYKKEGNTITFLKEYLSDLLPGRHYFAFAMSGGSHPNFTLEILIYEPEEDFGDEGDTRDEDHGNEDEGEGEDDQDDDRD